MAGVGGSGRVSEREAEVLAALGSHLTNAQIANRLHISVRTVESHVSSLLRKYGVADRTELAELSRSGAPAPGRLAGLPTVTTSFVGRTRERDALLGAIAGARLVSLLGPGGVGKTRLAAVVAEAAVSGFPSGGAWVDLVPVRDGFVARAIAAALGVTEGSHQPLHEAVASRIGDGRSLLVLDNCEHVVEEAAAFAERMLAACPGIHVLVTSRERLGIPGERSVPIAPLPLGSDAERLFHDRAVAADPDFVADRAMVEELCAHLDGVPLAIELAAARSASLGASGLLAALEDTLRLLSGGRGADERHRSLRAVIGWSYDLLDEEEKALFRRLAAFAGAFDLDAAVAVSEGISDTRDRGAVADLLGRLVDKSLVGHLRGATSRWRLLETVGAYALDQLDAAGERPAARARHRRWAAETAAALESRVGSDGWRDDFDAVAGDLRAALAAAPADPHPVTHRLARSLAHLTYARRYLMEAFGHYKVAAELAPSPAEAAQDLRSAAGCAHVSTTSNLHVFELLAAAAERAEAAGDGDRRAIDLARAVETACRFPDAFPAEIPRRRLLGMLEDATAAGNGADPVVAACLATARAWLASPAKADPDAELAQAAAVAARATADPVLVSAGLCAVSTAAVNAGRLRDAHRVTRERLALLPLMDRDDPYFAPEICNTFGRACAYAIMVGDVPAGMATADAALGDDLLSHSYISASRLVPPLVLTGQFVAAVEHADRMWDEWERAGRPAPRWMLPAVSTTALAYGILGDRARLRLWKARIAETAGAAARMPAVAEFVDARLAVHTGDLADAAVIVDRAFAADLAADPYASYARAAGAELAVVAGLALAAERVTEATEGAAENAWAAACIARATGRLHGDATALSASLEGWERIDARFERACTLLLLPDREAEGQAELAALGAAL